MQILTSQSAFYICILHNETIKEVEDWKSVYGTPSGFGNRSRTSWKRYIAIDRTCTVKWASFITYSIIVAQVEIKNV